MGTYDRRSFLRRSAMLAAAVAAGRLLPAAAAFGQDARRPLEILALGDSVMWGQGLREEEKFYGLTRRWLEGALGGRAVGAPKVKAHSGATILPKPLQTGACHGEVNYSSPTVRGQLREAVGEYKAAGTDPASVDLVLINGGINDMGGYSLFNPSFTAEMVKDAAEAFCHLAMRELLGEVAASFCHARVVVTGYFPLVSTRTPPDMLLDAILLAVGDNEFIKRFGRGAFDLVRRRLGLRPGQVGPILERAARTSAVWYTESTLALQRAVAEANGESDAAPRGDACERGAPAPGATRDPLDRRIVFAQPRFGPEHCYGAPNTYLWKLVDADRRFDPFESPIKRLKTDDRFFEERAELCRCEAASKSGLKFEICQRAGTSHPNVEGAAEYARAIQAALTPVLPFTGWAGERRVAAVSPAAVSPASGLTAFARSTRAEAGRGSDHPFFTQARNRPEVIAHRGGKGQWPEETVHACAQALKLGADVLEVDVRASHDGELVLMHDETVDRTTNGRGPVSDFTLAQLKELDAGYEWERGGCEPLPCRGRGLRVATLKEVFEAFPDARLNIEIKQSSPSVVAPLCKLIRDYGREEKVLVASFSDGVLREFRRECPEVATSAASAELVRFILRNAPLVPGAFKPEADAVQVKESLLTRPLVERAHRLNLQVHVWTVNEPRQMSRAAGLGVDGIITDYPGRLLTLLGRAR